MPAAFSANEYNTKCLPTLLYVSQLCPPPSPHLLQTELGAIHKILHLPPQAISYNLAINFGPIAGFNIRSAYTAMNASMIRFALKSFPQAHEVNKNLIQATLDSVPFCFLSNKPGTPVTPGWDSPAYVSNLAAAMQHNNSIGIGVPEFATYIRKITRSIERNFGCTRRGYSAETPPPRSSRFSVAALVQEGLGSMINSYSDPHWLAVIRMDKCTEL